MMQMHLSHQKKKNHFSLQLLIVFVIIFIVIVVTNRDSVDDITTSLKCL